MMRARASCGLLGVCVLLGMALAAGCGIPPSEYAAVNRQLFEAQDEIRQLKEQVAAKDQVIRIKQQDLVDLRHMKPEDLEQLIVPVSIQLERLSGGFERNEKPGDDGIVVYVQPVDRDGDIIKAAGSLKVSLLDLANPPDQYLIGEYAFDVPHTRELWSGRLWTSHFSVHCPWYPGKPPKHDEITARVEFFDLLTGQTLTAQGVYKIKLPSSTTAAAQ